MAERSQKRTGPLTFVLLLANIAMIVWIALSFAAKDKTGPAGNASPASAKPGNTPAPAILPETVAYTEMIPELPDLSDSELALAQSDGNSLSEAVPQPQADDAGPQESEPKPSASANPEAAFEEGDRRPTYDDFNWYFNDVSYYGVYDDAEYITDLEKILGEWKAYIYYDYENTTGNACEMLFNVNIDAGQEDIAVTCDWYYLRFISSSEPEYQNDSTVYRGSWDGSAIHAKGSGTMDLTRFFSYQGMQYATGEMTDARGVKAEIALVRKEG